MGGGKESQKVKETYQIQKNMQRESKSRTSKFLSITPIVQS